MAVLMPPGKQQYFDANGDPLVGGKLWTYDAGTVVPRPTFTTAAGTISHPNPVILDARGEATIFWDGAYKVVLTDAADVTIWTVDNIVTPDITAVVDDAIDELVEDLADKTDAELGAGMIGYNPSLDYPPGTVGDKLQDFVTFEDFGAIGDGVANDSVAVRAAFDALEAGTITALYGTPGAIYRMTLVVPPMTPVKPVTVDFRGATLDCSGVAVGGIVLYFLGSIGTPVPLTVSGVLGSTILTVASTATFARKQWVRVVSESVWDQFNTNTRVGELARLLDMPNGVTTMDPTVLTLATPLQDLYATSQSATVTPVNMIPPVTVRNGRFIARTANQNDQIALRIQYCVGALVENCYFEQFDFSTVFLRNVVDTNVLNCNFYNSRPTGLGYGVEVADAACDVVIQGCHFEDIRHALSTNNTTSSDYGITRRVTFTENTVRSSAVSQGPTSTFTAATSDILTLATPANNFTSGRSVTVSTGGTLPGGLSVNMLYWTGTTTGSPVATLKLYRTAQDAAAQVNAVDITSTGSGTHSIRAYGGGDSIDTHGGADFIKIIGNITMGATGHGINVECPNCEIVGNTVIDAGVFGISVHNEADRNGRAVISNNRIHRSAGAGISLQQGTRGTAFSYVTSAISGNSISDAGIRTGAYALNAGIVVKGNGNVLRGVTVSANSANSAATYGIYIEQVRGASVVGNSVYNNEQEGISAVDALFSTINSNSVQVSTNSTFVGIKVDATAVGLSSRNSITGNSVGPAAGTGTAVAIVLGNNVTFTNVVGNTTGNMAGVVTLGAGAGNLQTNNL